MRLEWVSVKGFRSLGDVESVPVRRPTVLTGHNDSGKSALLDAIEFLLGAYQLTTEDRTFAATNDADLAGVSNIERVALTEVIGTFRLSTAEQTRLNAPETVQIRRVAEGGPAQLEIELNVPAEPRFRDLANQSLLVLRELARDFKIDILPASSLKAVWVERLSAHADGLPRCLAWVTADAVVKGALPRVLRFGDADAAEVAVKAALTSRYRMHLESEEFSQQVKDLQEQLRERLKEDAQGLIDHIKRRCSDFATVAIEPEVSFSGGLFSTRLKLAQKDGEEIGLSSAGSGRTRRISLAIWEWTSEILRQDAVDLLREDPEFKDVIIIYDEPDTHLDYLQQRRIMKLIREQCQIESVSMVVATHSMNLIDGSAIDDIVHLKLNAT